MSAQAQRGAASEPQQVAQPEPLNLVWALVPLVSLGTLSWAPFLYATVRTGAQKFKIATGVYLSLSVVAGVLLAVAGHGHGGLNTFAGLLLILLAGAGCAHTLAIRNEYGRQLALFEDPTLLEAQQREQRRARALRLVKQNPKRALQLGVGRPDVKGSFDGGLVDVNHANAKALATLPGVDADKAKQIVELRESADGFSSADDLDVVLDLEPGTLAQLRERVVFLPRT
jgi:DNA uptake protein ComE-like DNA-binding protein